VTGWSVTVFNLAGIKVRVFVPGTNINVRTSPPSSVSTLIYIEGFQISLGI